MPKKTVKTEKIVKTAKSEVVAKPAAQHREYEGVVLVAKDKTINVKVTTKKMHPIYRKAYAQTKKFAVHDEKSLAKVGDVVIFQECRPISKTKKWSLVKVK